MFATHLPGLSSRARFGAVQLGDAAQCARHVDGFFVGNPARAAPLHMGFDAFFHFRVGGVAGGQVHAAVGKQSFGVGAFARTLAAQHKG